MLYRLISLLSQIKTYIEIQVFLRNLSFINKTGKKVLFTTKEEKLLIVVAHVVLDPEKADAEKLERLTQTLDGLIKSVTAYSHQIILLSKKGYSLHRQLPPYLQERVQVIYSEKEDPMLVEFDGFELFKQHVDAFDYFLFLEDDIILSDSWFLEKIKRFNSYSPFPHYVLLPHRFEYANGVKYYLDQELTINSKSKRYTHSEALKVDFGDVSFCVYENPHAALHCLSKRQVEIWIKSDYHWKDRTVVFGKLESAATFSLLENFKFLKPHTSCFDYFEVQHYGDKYMKKKGFYKQTCKQ